MICRFITFYFMLNISSKKEKAKKEKAKKEIGEEIGEERRRKAKKMNR